VGCCFLPGMKFALGSAARRSCRNTARKLKVSKIKLKICKSGMLPFLPIPPGDLVLKAWLPSWFLSLLSISISPLGSFFRDSSSASASLHAFYTVEAIARSGGNASRKFKVSKIKIKTCTSGMLLLLTCTRRRYTVEFIFVTRVLCRC
jgi:hypothetical protein